MSGKIRKTSRLSMSTPSVKKAMTKIPRTPKKREESPTASGVARIALRPSSSPLAEVYQTEDFRKQWNNSISFHVARNLLHLRRYRGMSQLAVGKLMGTSQSAIARIESAQENITLDTLERLTAALKGSFFVSIQPEEFVTKIAPSWWDECEGVDPSWRLAGIQSRQTVHMDQVVIGLERPRTFITGGTVLSRLLPEGRT